MGCSCPTLRGTCNAATVLDGRARRLACFSMGSQDLPELPPFPSGGVLLANAGARQKRRGRGTFAFTRALRSQGRLVYTKGGKR